jgi:hypothetical protein
LTEKALKAVFGIPDEDRSTLTLEEPIHQERAIEDASEGSNETTNEDSVLSMLEKPIIQEQREVSKKSLNRRLKRRAARQAAYQAITSGSVLDGYYEITDEDWATHSQEEPAHATEDFFEDEYDITALTLEEPVEVDMRFEDFQNKVHQRAAREVARYVRKKSSSQRAIWKKKSADYDARLQAAREARANEASAQDFFNKDPAKLNLAANRSKRIDQMGAEIALSTMELDRRENAWSEGSEHLHCKDHDARIMPQMRHCLAQVNVHHAQAGLPRLWSAIVLPHGVTNSRLADLPDTFIIEQVADL